MAKRIRQLPKTERASGNGPERHVLIAGMPRSGSTWQFNAVRLIMEDSGVPHWSGWCTDIKDADENLRIVKAHRPEQISFSPDLVFTTRRPFEECLASLIRMGWCPDRRGPVRRRYHSHRSLYHFWAGLSDYETRYNLLVNEPVAEIARLEEVLSKHLDLPADPGRAERVQTELSELKEPPEPDVEVDPDLSPHRQLEMRHDKTSLLHPGHTGSSQEIVPRVRNWIRNLA